MGPLLSIAVVIFGIGFLLGYGVREIISQNRRARAKRNRRFFDDARIGTN